MTTVATFCAPAFHHVPPHVGTYGDEVADLAASAGLDLDPEQRLAVDAMYAHDARGRLVSTEFGCAAPRQQVKTHIAKAAALADLVLFDEPECLWTAQLKTTAASAFANGEGNGVADLFENYDHLRRLVDRNGISADSDEPSVTLRRPGVGLPRPRLRFMARSARGGRGLTGRRITFDEALFLKPEMTQAMVPVLSAKSMTGAVQVRYLGSAGLRESAVWREVRNRGRSGAERFLAWLEWAAPTKPCVDRACAHLPGVDGCALDDPELIAAANLALGRRMSLDWVLGTERLAMTPAAFMAERLGWWDDPPEGGCGDLDVDAWLALALPPPALVGPSFGVDVDSAGSAFVGVAWRRHDGGVHVQLAGGTTASALDARCVELRAKHGGAIYAGGPALEHVSEAEAVGMREFAGACQRFADMLDDGVVHHCDEAELNDAVRLAQWRAVGSDGARAWQLKNAAGVGPLAAVTRAVHGLLNGDQGGWAVSV